MATNFPLNTRPWSGRAIRRPKSRQLQHVSYWVLGVVLPFITLLKIVALNSSLAFWSKSCPWIMRICLRKVDLPLSPAPSNRIFTSLLTYVLSRLIHLSISLDFRICSTSPLVRRQLGKNTDKTERDGRKSAIFETTSSIQTAQRAELTPVRWCIHVS